MLLPPNVAVPMLLPGDIPQYGLDQITKIFPDVLLFTESDPCSKQLSNISQSSFTTSSTEGFSLAKQWIEGCDKDHTACHSTKTPGDSLKSWKPSRLVRIVSQGKDPDYLVVEENIPHEAKYLTLSYCWGSQPNFIKLLQKNLAQFQKCIPLSDLPLTFKDTIQVANELGITYLWIDALCIIQDSQDDWEKESAQMVHIYSCAYVNIAALASPDAEGGLFRSRSPASINAIPLQLHLKGEKPERYRAVLDHTLEMESAPLVRRGWIFQERTLSTRTLFFGRRCLSWECRENHHYSEAYPTGVPWEKNRDSNVMERFSYFSPKHTFGKMLATVSEHYFLSEDTELPLKEDYTGDRKHLWDSVVKEYSRCELTRAEDKLVALAGIIHNFRLRFKDECCAGMWRKELPSSLLWSVRGDGIRPSRYRAPSWSWASVDGAILPALKTTRVTARIVDLMPNWQPTLYGLGETSSIMVEGHLYKATLTKNMEAENTYDLTFGHGLKEATVLATLSLDVPSDRTEVTAFPDERSIFCLDVAETEYEFQSRVARLNALSINSYFRSFFRLEMQLEASRNAIEGLLLEPTGKGRGQYRRIGVFRVGSYSMRIARAMRSLRIWRSSRHRRLDLRKPRRLWEWVDDAHELPKLGEDEYVEHDGKDKYTCELV